MFKATLFGLLVANTAYFGLYGTASKAVDAAAWLTLLILYEAEIGFGHRLESVRAKRLLRALRLVAAAGVFAATIGYVFEENVLDAANSGLWIAVVLLLELELRLPELAADHRRTFGGIALSLYGALAVLVVLWALRGMWFDAYDAVLWLIAFATIELDITHRKTAVRA